MNLKSIITQRIIFILLLILIFEPAGYSQRRYFSKDSIANSVVYLSRDMIVKGILQTFSGTGTFISKDNKLFIVTASHVEKNIDLKGYVIIKGSDDKPIKLNITDLLIDNNVKWIESIDADVSLIELKPKKWVFEAGYMVRRFLPSSIFFDTLKSVSRETLLTTFGFPMQLGISGYFSPLTYRTFVSSGLITLPRFDNKKLTTFILLENPSTAGYSGGLVFDIGKIETSNIEMQKGTGTICYGIIHGTISDNTGGKIAAIIPSFYILELLKKATYTLQNLEASRPAS